MRNKREIILDFTSLLDVVMLILFFFVIFTQFDVADAISQAEAAKNSAEIRSSEAQAELEAAKQAKEQAESEMNRLQNANAMAESVIINGDSEFNRALRLKLWLIRDDDSWSLTINSAKVENGEQTYTKIGCVADIRKLEPLEIANEFDDTIVSFNYSSEDAFLCDIMFDSSEPGSNKAKRNVDNALLLLQNEHSYQYMFVSITDLSYMEE